MFAVVLLLHNEGAEVLKGCILSPALIRVAMVINFSWITRNREVKRAQKNASDKSE